MALIRKLRAGALAVATVAVAAFAAPTWATTGQFALPDLYGAWNATLNGMTGCGPSAMFVAINMNTAGTGTATLTTHGQCGDSTVSGQTFKITSMNANGTGTANLSCGTGCGWNLKFQVSPDRGVMNLIDVDPVNPGNYIAGVAVHF